MAFGSLFWMTLAILEIVLVIFSFSFFGIDILRVFNMDNFFETIIYVSWIISSKALILYLPYLTLFLGFQWVSNGRIKLLWSAILCSQVWSLSMLIDSLYEVSHIFIVSMVGSLINAAIFVHVYSKEKMSNILK